MTRINLLPWREELRQERQKQFVTLLILTVVLAAAIVGLIHFHLNAKINYQEARNRYLQTEIAKLDEKIKEIRELRKLRKSLIERMEVIQDLQASRPSIVHLFTELVTTVPEGVYLKTLKQEGDKLHLTGAAESNARVSSYMRNMSNSEWLKEPNLDVIEIKDKKVQRISSFILKVKQTSPNAEQANEEESMGGQEK
jgi:type IV pilus assembly protein PilN